VPLQEGSGEFGRPRGARIARPGDENYGHAVAPELVRDWVAVYFYRGAEL
jgi:hypothetical protein